MDLHYEYTDPAQHAIAAASYQLDYPKNVLSEACIVQGNKRCFAGVQQLSKSMKIRREKNVVFHYPCSENPGMVPRRPLPTLGVVSAVVNRFKKSCNAILRRLVDDYQAPHIAGYPKRHYVRDW